jgi:hypothetical protein
METNSFIINKFIALFSLIGKYYEYSLIYAVLHKLSLWIGESRLWRLVKKGLFIPSGRNYIEGSFFLRLPVMIFEFIFNIIKRLYNFAGALNKSSLNKKLFDRYIMPLRNPVNIVGAVGGFLGGVFLFMTLYTAITSFSLKKLIILVCITLICFYITFFISGNIRNAVKNSIPYKLMLSFFDRD